MHDNIDPEDEFRTDATSVTLNGSEDDQFVYGRIELPARLVLNELVRFLETRHVDAAHLDLLRTAIEQGTVNVYLTPDPDGDESEPIDETEFGLTFEADRGNELS